MELILKQPAEKPPFIGVLFEDQITSGRVNKSPIENYYTDHYKITFEPIGDKISLKLTSSICSFEYTDLKFDPGKFQTFLEVNKDSPIFNFSHITDELGTHMVVRSITNRRLWVLKVNKVELLLEF